MRRIIKSVIFLVVLSITFSQFSILHASALWDPPQQLTSNAVLLVNADTNTVIYEKNQDQKVYPASITKLMTAILVYEKFKDKLDTKVTVQKKDYATLDPYASRIGLKENEQLTIEQLLNCLLIASGDDAANVLARVTSGSVEDFVAQMNKKAKAIGLKYTHYANPHGLTDQDHYTTASDVYKLAKYAMRYELLKKIVATPSYTLPATNVYSKERQLNNTNFLIRTSQKTYYYKYVKGIKTGFTTPAGKCLVSYAEKDGKTYYCVVMGGQVKNGVNMAFLETKELYQWVFKTFDIKPVVKTTDTAAQVNVELGANKTKLLLRPQSQLNALLPSTYKSSNIKITLHIPSKVTAPIKKGQVIGTESVTFLSDTGKTVKLGTVKLVAGEEVELSKPLYVLSKIRKFFNSIWFKVVAILLILLLIAYVSFSVYINRQKNMMNSKRMKKYRHRK